MKSVIVIGSGLGGLSAAYTAAARGHQVRVLEKNAWTGGKAAVLEQDGFRFDMGPTVLTTPSILRRVLEESGEKLEDHLDLVRLDPQWRAFFSDRSVLDLSEDLHQMKENLREFSRVADDELNYERFLLESQRLHEIFQELLLWKPVGRPTDVLERGRLMPASLKRLISTRPHQSVRDCVRAFVKDERTAQMLEHFAQYAGSSPESSPALLCGAAHAQTQEGIWYPKGGTRALPKVLRSLCEGLGVEFLTGVTVKAIEVNEEGRVLGVTDKQGEFHSAEAVVSNVDAVRTHRDFLRGGALTNFEARREYEPACSGVLFYLGLKKRYHQLVHHNFVFSKSPSEEFKSLYEAGEPSSDPTVYVAAPARTDPSVAPAGQEALYILVHTPYLRPHHNWGKLLPKYRQVIFQKLADCAGMEDLEDRIVCESVLTPQSIQDRYNVLNGAIYGLASHGKVHGAFRPGNRSADVEGLYLAGGSAHPGPGMSRAVMSGWIAADALDSDTRLQS